MDKLFDDTKKYLTGKLDLDNYLEKIYSVSAQMENMISGCGDEANSFYESARKGISYLREAASEENKLRLKALLCDISNNFAHALEVKARRNPTPSTDYYAGVFYGMKQGMVFEIIRECKYTKNKSYGMTKDNTVNPVFAVDIPYCGQVSWHFPQDTIIKSKQYDFELEKKNVHITNMKLLCEEIKRDEYEMLSKHSQKVIDSQSVEEMNEELYPSQGILGLSDLVNKEPTIEEINMGTINEDKIISEVSEPDTIGE